MARPAAVATLAASPINLIRATTVAAALLLLAMLIAWPVTAVAVHGLLVAWPWRAGLQTLAVALGATLLAAGPALLIALALTRVDVPGRRSLWHLLRLGAVVPPFVVPLALLALAGPQGLLAPGGARRGLAAIVVGQALAFLPGASVLLVRALARVPAELEQVAAVLGATRTTILRRVTLALAGPAVLRAALLVLGLCLADVTVPILLGGEARVLATTIVAAAPADPAAAAGAALMLGVLTAAVVAPARPWRLAAADRVPLRRLESPAPPILRWLLGLTVWGVAAGLVGLWAAVPLGSLLRGGGSLTLEHWRVLATPTAAEALRNSLALGLGVAVSGTLLAVVTGWVAERRGTSTGRGVELLARLPLLVPGVVAGVGYLLLAAALPLGLAGALPVLVAVVACWELPVSAQTVRAALVRADRSVEDAAISLGASALTTLRRVVAPPLWPAAGVIFGSLLGAGLLAIGAVIVLTGPGRALGALAMLTLAAAGATGAACAVATALLALAGGAVLLGRAIAGRQRGPTSSS